MRHVECWRRVLCCVADSAVRSTLQPRCPHLSPARLQAGDVGGARDGEREALRIFRELGDRRGEAIGLSHLAQIAAWLGDFEEARTQLEQCLAIAREIKYQELEGACELLSGEVAFELGELTEANLWFKRSLTLCREAADKRGEANALRWLAKCAIENGDLTSARARLVDASRAFKNFEMWEELLGCLEDFAELLHREGAAGLAIRISGAVARARERLSLARSPRAELRCQTKIVELAERSPRRLTTQLEMGLEWDVDDALRTGVAASDRPLYCRLGLPRRGLPYPRQEAMGRRASRPMTPIPSSNKGRLAGSGTTRKVMKGVPSGGLRSLNPAVLCPSGGSETNPIRAMSFSKSRTKSV